MQYSSSCSVTYKEKETRVKNKKMQLIRSGYWCSEEVYDPDVWRLVAMLGSFTTKELIAGPHAAT